MPQALLYGNRRNLREPSHVFLLFELGQGSTQVTIVQTLLLLRIGITPYVQGPIVHVSATSEGTGKNMLLFIGWIEPIFVGFLLFHRYEYSKHAWKCQAFPPDPCPKQGTPLVSP